MLTSLSFLPRAPLGSGRSPAVVLLSPSSPGPEPHSPPPILEASLPPLPFPICPPEAPPTIPSRFPQPSEAAPSSPAKRGAVTPHLSPGQTGPIGQGQGRLEAAVHSARGEHETHTARTEAYILDDKAHRQQRPVRGMWGKGWVLAWPLSMASGDSVVDLAPSLHLLICATRMEMGPTACPFPECARGERERMRGK